MIALPDNTVSGTMRRHHALPMLAAVLAAALFLVLHMNGYRMWAFSAGGSLSALLAVLALTLALYHACLWVWNTARTARGRHEMA